LKKEEKKKKKGKKKGKKKLSTAARVTQNLRELFILQIMANVAYLLPGLRHLMASYDPAASSSTVPFLICSFSS
jgi:hypothetical protein